MNEDLKKLLKEALADPKGFDNLLADFLTSPDKQVQIKGRIAASTIPDIAVLLSEEFRRDSSPKATGTATGLVAEACGFFIGVAVAPAIKEGHDGKFASIVTTFFFNALLLGIEVGNDARE